MEQKFDVIVIGGGAIGICSAYYLSKNGLSVAVIEKNEIGKESSCSFGNAGLISPSHFVPLAAPGMVAKGLKWMFNPESPFYIHPRMDDELLKWLWRYFRACNEKKMRLGIPILRDLTTESLRLFEKINSDENISYGFEHRGLLMLHNTVAGEKANKHEAHLAEEVGVEARLLNNEELNELEPNVKILSRGGLYFPNDGHLIPDQFLNAMAELAKKNGVAFFPKTEAMGFEKKENRLVSVVTPNGKIGGKEFILASGSWAPLLLKKLSLNISVQPGKGYSVTVKQPAHLPKIPFILTEARVAITPMGGALRFGGTLELSPINLTINERRVKAILNAVPAYLDDMRLDAVNTKDAWAGLRPCSPDGLPFIGRFESVPNLIAATGHAMLGITLSPITGKLVSEIVANEKTVVDISQLKPDRY
ncbi:FAD-dependent oxidoreductase [bacterium]|nr:MAG: FAD-dependent oxidoreductase [bacterium]